MAILDFPASPTNGQIYVGSNGVTYQYSSTYTAWLVVGSTSSIIFVSDTAPASPPDNSLWWKSDIGVLYVRYNDGNSTQWVPASPVPQQPVQTGWRSLGSQVVTTPVAQLDFPSIPVDINHLQFIVANLVPATNDTALYMRYFDGNGVIDTTNNYSSHLVQDNTTFVTGGSPPTVSVALNTSVIVFNYNAAGNAVNSSVVGGGISVDAKIMGIRNSQGKRLMTFSAYYLNGNNTASFHVSGGGQWINSTVLSGLRFYFPAVNMVSGSISLWGSP